MKTQQEVENMKDDVCARIEMVNALISDVCDRQNGFPGLQSLQELKKQLLAQNEVLLEVLK